MNSAREALRKCWRLCDQAAAALRSDKSIPGAILQDYLSRLDDLQDACAVLSAEISKGSSAPDPNTNTKKDGKQYERRKNHSGTHG